MPPRGVVFRAQHRHVMPGSKIAAQLERVDLGPGAVPRDEIVNRVKDSQTGIHLIRLSVAPRSADMPFMRALPYGVILASALCTLADAPNPAQEPVRLASLAQGGPNRSRTPGPDGC